MIILKDVTKIYNKKENTVPALDGISLSIQEGEAVAIMGPSGSGKTTLLNIIGCMDEADSGEYLYGDLAVSTLSKSKADVFRKKTIGFVFQQFALLKDYTVLENVEIPLRAMNIGKKKRKEICMSWLSRMGMAEYAKQFPTKLSGGQQQRCAIARALVTGAPIVLADEPTGALDQKTGQEIIELLLGLNQEGKTVIVVTHDEKVAERMQRIVRLSDGKIVSDEKTNGPEKL